MTQHAFDAQKVITTTEIRRNLSAVLQRLRRSQDHAIIESSGKPVAVILSLDEYQRLVARRRASTAFYNFSRNFGRDIEKLDLTEEEFMSDLEKTKRKVFAEQYGQAAR